MYKNYGDANFFEYGRLVEMESDTEYRILYCQPFENEEDRFIYAELLVNISDDWIDKKAVMECCGMTEETFDPIQFAIDCTFYYSIENFGAFSFYFVDYTNYTREMVCECLRNKEIDPNGIHIEW